MCYGILSHERGQTSLLCQHVTINTGAWLLDFHR